MEIKIWQPPEDLLFLMGFVKVNDHVFSLGVAPDQLIYYTPEIAAWAMVDAIKDKSIRLAITGPEDFIEAIAFLRA